MLSLLSEMKLLMLPRALSSCTKSRITALKSIFSQIVIDGRRKAAIQTRHLIALMLCRFWRERIVATAKAPPTSPNHLVAGLASRGRRSGKPPLTCSQSHQVVEHEKIGRSSESSLPPLSQLPSLSNWRKPSIILASNHRCRNAQPW